MVVYDLSNSFYPCPKPKKTHKKGNKKIKQKSYKLAKLERNRSSIITDNLDECFFCNNKREDLHEAFRGRNRQKSIIWKLIFPLCRKHHYKATIDKEFSSILEQIARNIFVKKYGKEKFIEEFK